MPIITMMVRDGFDQRSTDLTVSATEPHQISETYTDEFGQLSITITPSNPKDSGRYETCVDLSLEDAKILRDAVGVMIEFLERKRGRKIRVPFA